jgi:adenosine deaminase
MDVDEFLRRIPKVELHNHVTGAVRLETFVELARKNGVPLPSGDPKALYEYEDLIAFLTSHSLVCQTLQHRDDFARVAYECLEDGLRNGNVRYMEFFFNPTIHMNHGIPYADVVAGLVDGIRRAESELGIRGRLIPSINRQESVAVAQAMLDEILAHRHDEVIGIGMDHDELPDPPEKFASVYQAAGRAGLRRTAHTSHDGPARHILTCLDLLGCDRIDHGYRVTTDAEVLKRVVDEQVPFALSFTSAQIFWLRPENDEPGAQLVNPVGAMWDAGVNLTLHSDDPTMLHTDPGNEYVQFFNTFAVKPERAREMTLAALEASWLSEAEKSTLRKEFEAEIGALESALSTP